MDSTAHPGCEGCQFRVKPEVGNWCYMFKDAPTNLPCAQHDKFALEREMTMLAIKRNPAILTLLIAAFEQPQTI